MPKDEEDLRGLKNTEHPIEKRKNEFFVTYLQYDEDDYALKCCVKSTYSDFSDK